LVTLLARQSSTQTLRSDRSKVPPRTKQLSQFTSGCPKAAEPDARSNVLLPTTGNHEIVKVGFDEQGPPAMARIAVMPPFRMI